ncbi:protein NEN1 isoform X2 [Lactuca sativa]|uniref:protein NEN1 isoform X2 n=1 Tax=Lactuca sativa TaxID=4236 RepID=UPI000CD8C771|nr:protein NEN1 isoform X2 [Lactuca sativa]
MVFSVDRSEIAFFDLETTIPTRHGQPYAILEFGSILVCPKKLIELESFETLVRPHDLSLISASSVRANGITADAVVSAPTFSDIADRVYDILHGRVWAGHNILRFDCVRLREAYVQINRPPPEPKGTIDSLALLTQRFGRRAGDMKMASLAAYFGLGQQSHRSLDDVRMNFEVVKHCATVLFLESANPGEDIPIPIPIPSNEAMVEDSSSTTQSDAFTPQTEFLPSNEVSMASITVSSSSVSPYFHGSHKIQILHRDIPLQIRCDSMRIRFGLSTKYLDHAGRPRLSFVVDANSSNLCDLLNACDNITKRFMDSDSNSEWRPLVSRKPGFYDSPTIRFHLRTEDGDGSGWTTEIYKKESSSLSSLSIPQLVTSSRYDVAELDWLFRPGGFVDAYLCLDPYNYQQNAGIRLVAKKLPFGYAT